MSLPLVIAHRGDSVNALENSPDAIRRALSYPVDMIELDVRSSLDNALFVMHDRTTARTASASVDIERSTAAEISEVRLKNGEPVPTLTDVFGVVAGNAGLNLEIKSDGAGLLTAEFLASSDYPGYVLVSSFKEMEVLAFRRVRPHHPTSLIFDVFAARDVPAYRESGYRIISLRKTAVSRGLIEACHEQGVQVYVWTVDDEEEMKKIISWGADGIYSNRPGALKEIVRNSESSAGNDK